LGISQEFLFYNFLQHGHYQLLFLYPFYNFTLQSKFQISNPKIKKQKALDLLQNFIQIIMVLLLSLKKSIENKILRFIMKNKLYLTDAVTKVLSSLDIGGNKIVCLIGEMSGSNGDAVFLKSVGIRESKGIENGNIANVKEFTETARKVISSAEKIYGKNIRSVFVNLTGDDVQSSLISLEKPLLVSNMGITQYDIYRVSSEIVDKFENNDKEVIQTVLISSNKSDVLGEDADRNRKDKKVKYTFNVVHANRAKTDKIRSALRKIDVNVENFVCNSYASSFCASDYEVTAKIVLLIDIGYEFTDFCVLQNGKIIFNSCVRLAGKILTQDIASILRAPFDLAEEVKIKNTTLFLDTFEEKENIKVNIDGSDDSFRVAKEKRKLINDIFFARMEEIVKRVKSTLEKKKIFDRIESVILSGGTSNVFGLEKFVEDILGKKTRKIFTNNLEINKNIDKEKIKNPVYSTSAGLLLFASKIYQQEMSLNKNSPRNGLSNFINGLLQGLVNLFIS
jgi:cell division protein FtsA